MHNIDILGGIVLDTIGFLSDSKDISKDIQLIHSIENTYGGRGANIAIAISNSSVEPRLISIIGYDFESSGYKEQLFKNQVITDLTLVQGQLPHAYVFRNHTHVKNFFFPGIFSQLDEKIHEKIRNSVLSRKPDALISTSEFGETDLYCFEKSKASLKIYSPGQMITFYQKKYLERMLNNTDALFINKEELEYLKKVFRVDSPNLTKYFGMKFQVVTNGKNGSEIFTNKSYFKIHPFTPRRIIDETGAGDNYMGLFIAEYLKTRDLVSSAEIASSSSSFIVEEYGTQTNIPSYKRIKERKNKER